MAVGTGIYVTWVTGAILISIALIPVFKPPYAKLSLDGFIDMFRRYWAHMIVVFSVYLWKDLLDGLDRVLMANTQLDMTFLVYAIEGDISLWIQESFRSDFLDTALTHFYVMGFMIATFSSFVYPIYFDDRHMADRVSLSMFWVYLIAVPFYLFMNVRVTGDYIQGMETIAYDLTPEIHNWFNRIDPFTNGMPSLHIGLPFAIWLSMHRWDQDGRWAKYRIFLISFIALTAFSIVYLGIHWVVDIIGGIAVAILAVNITDKTHGPIWRIADERLFTRRLARFIQKPVFTLKKSIKSVSSTFDPIREPGSSQTGAFILAMLFVTGSVLLWDATHQNFTLDDADSASSASGSGEWLISVENSTEMGVSINAWNVSSQFNRSVGGKPWDKPPEVFAQENCFVLYGGNRFDYFEHDGNEGVIHPLIRRNTIHNIADLAIAKNSDGGIEIALLTVFNNSHTLLLYDISTNSSTQVPEAANSTVISSSGPLVTWAAPSNEGPIANITSVETGLTISIVLDPRSEYSVEKSLEESGYSFDYNNSSVVDMAMSSKWLVATVDIGPFNRTLLVDTQTGNQTLLSNPRWDSSSPSIANDVVAFLQVTRDDPTGRLLQSQRNNDVYYYNTTGGTLIQLTLDENIDQSEPQVLDGGIAWVANNGDGSTQFVVHSFGEPIETYSRTLLQASVLALLPLLFVYAYQSAIEKD